MNKQLQDTILSFTKSESRTIAEIADHLYLTMQKHADHRFIGNSMRHLTIVGLVKKCDRRKVNNAYCNTYKATTVDERIALEESNKLVTSVGPSFSHDPIMAAFYSKVNI